MKQKIFCNWNLMRALRLVIGLAIAIQGFIANDKLFIIAGLLFTGIALFNIGCCGAGGCNTPIIKNDKPIKDISYEEVV